MCGIAGFIGARPEELRRMSERLVHRGPDDDGCLLSTYQGRTVGLLSRRLSIRDLSQAGHMPMRTADGRYSIVYNGEIYNASELKELLVGRGCAFRSHSDTEVVLYAYQEFGPACLARLNGMFAFAIWDQECGRLFLARDHFGIKPLYYYIDKEKFVFASEAKSILEVSDVPRGIDPRALHQYLTLLWVPDPLTMFPGILKVPAGHFGIYERDAFTLHQYWDIPVPNCRAQFPKSEEELKEELRARWLQTIKSQLVSDVPLGAFLSAGLDSSSIVAGMRGAGVETPRTFTIAFPPRTKVGEVTLDDTDVAARTASHFGCIHHNIIVSPNVASLLPKLIWHLDEPIADPAIIMAYLVAREARESVTVLLSGVGGDELFAGYRKHQAHYWALHYQKIPAVMRRGLIEPLMESLPSFRGTPLKGYARLAKKMARSGSLSPVERFLMDSVYLTERQKSLLYTSEYRELTADVDPFERHRAYFDRVKDADFLNQMLYLDLKTFTVSLNLTYNDKMSMASSVEVRVPFLDPSLAEWAFQNVPPALKLHGGVRKYLLREAMKPDLPAELFRQRKAGFGAPIDHWLIHDLEEMVGDLLGEEQVRKRGIFEPKVVSMMLREHRAGRRDWSHQIWQLLTLELWTRQFVDRS